MCNKVDLPIPNQFNQEHINYFSADSFAAMLEGTQCRLLYSKSIELRNDASQISEFSQIFMIQKCGDTTIERSEVLKRDDKTEAAIKQYLLQAEKKQDKTKAVIDKLCDDQTPLIIWGVGAMTMSLLGSTQLPQCNIVAFTDGNPLKIGGCFNGKEIIAPQELGLYPDAVIMISAMKSADEIKSRIVSLGLQNRIIII